MSQFSIRARLCAGKNVTGSSIQAQSAGGFTRQKRRSYGNSNSSYHSSSLTPGQRHTHQNQNTFVIIAFGSRESGAGNARQGQHVFASPPEGLGAWNRTILSTGFRPTSSSGMGTWWGSRY